MTDSDSINNLFLKKLTNTQHHCQFSTTFELQDKYAARFIIVYPKLTNDFKCVNAKPGMLTCCEMAPFLEDDSLYLIMDQYVNKSYCLLCWCSMYAPMLRPYEAKDEEITKTIKLANRISGTELACEEHLNPFTSLDVLEDSPELHSPLAKGEFEDQLQWSDPGCSMDCFYVCNWCSEEISEKKRIITKLHANLSDSPPECTQDCNSAFCSFECAYNHIESVHSISPNEITSDMAYQI